MNDQQPDQAAARLFDMSPRRFAVIDVETTGLDPEVDRILQVAAVVVDESGHVVDSFETVVKPESPSEYQHGAEHVHGITRDEVQNGMPLRAAIEKLKQISTNAVFTAHNARFDLGFLSAEASRVGTEWTVESVVDTLHLSRALDSSREYSHRLTDLCERYGIERDRAHNALSDARATAELLPKLLLETRLLNRRVDDESTLLPRHETP